MSKKRKMNGEAPPSGSGSSAGFLRFLVVTLLALFCVLLLQNQFGKLSSMPVSGVAVGFSVIQVLASIAGFWLIVIPLLVILIEWRGRVLERWIDGSRPNDRAVVILIAVLSFVLLRFYLAPGGGIYRGDSTYFVYMNWLSWVNLRGLDFFSFWTWLGGCGSVFNQFYAPLLSLVGGFLNLLFNDIHVSTKMANLVFRLFSAVGVYLFVRELTQDRKAGFLAAIASLLIHQLNHLILFPGRYSAGVELGVIPFLFFWFERWLKDRKWTSLVWISVFSALAILSHLKSSVLGMSFFSLYVVLRAILLRRDILKNILLPGLFAAIGLAITSYYMAGFVLEQKYVAWSEDIAFMGKSGIVSAQNPFLSYVLWNSYWLRLFPADYSQWQGGYIGISILVLFLLGFRFLFSKKDRQWSYLPLLTIALLCLVFTFFLKSHVIFKNVPFFGLTGTEKFLMLYTLFGSAAAGLGGLAISRIFPKLTATRAFLICLCVVCLDLVPTTFQVPYDRYLSESPAGNLMRWFKSNYEFKAGRAMNGTVMLAARHDQWMSDNWRNYDMWMAETAGVPTAVGHYVDDSSKWKPFVVTLNDKIAEWTVTSPQELPRPLMDGLFLCQTRFLVTTPYARSPFFGQNKLFGNIVVQEMKYMSPVVVSSRLKRFDYAEYYRDPMTSGSNHLAFLNGMKLDPASANADYIPVAAGSGFGPDLADAGKGKIGVVIKDEKVGLKTVELELSVDKDCYARLAFADYPAMEVRMDGKKTAHGETLEGMILLKLTAGTHRIAVIPHLTPLRIWSLRLALLLIAGLLLIVWLENRKKKTIPQGPDTEAAPQQPPSS